MNNLLSDLFKLLIACIIIYVLNKLFPSKNNNYEPTDDYDDNNSLFDIFDFFDSDDDDDDFDFDDD